MASDFELREKTYPMCRICPRREFGRIVTEGFYRAVQPIVDGEAKNTNADTRHDDPLMKKHHGLVTSTLNNLPEAVVNTDGQQFKTWEVMYGYIACGFRIGFDERIHGSYSKICQDLAYDQSLGMVVTKE